MIQSRAFKRSLESLEDIFAFTAEIFATHQLDARLLPAVDLTLEELFTNMVKYSKTSDAQVRLDLTRVPGGVEVTLTDPGVDFFDVTRAAEVDTGLPLQERTPGGLGLHLIKKMVDFIEYQYLEESRTSRITFRKTAVDRRDPRKVRDKRMLAIDFGADGKVVMASVEPLAPAAAEGRDWKYSGSASPFLLVNACPISSEPTAFPLRSMIEPFALS